MSAGTPCLGWNCDYPTPEDCYLCKRCTDRLSDSLRRLPGLLALLDDVATKQTSTGSNGKRGVGHEIGLPFREDAAELARWTRQMIIRTAHEVSEARIGRHVGMAHIATPILCAWLVDQVGWMRGQPRAEEWHDVILSYRRDIATKLDWHPERIFLGICGAAGCMMGLHGARERETITCPSCLAEHRTADLVAARERMASDALLDGEQLRRYARHKWAEDLSRQQLHMWIKRGNLSVQACRVSDHADLYRAGALVDLVTYGPSKTPAVAR